MQNIFDTHAHYDDERFDVDRDELLASLPQKGITGVVNAAVSLESTKASLALAQQYDFVYASAGFHPHEASLFQDGDIERLAEYAAHEKVVAIGEIGLDYHYDFSPRETQRSVFEKHLTLANDLDMPVIIHDREAHGDMLELLQKYRPKGIVHCFSGSAEMAWEIVKLGMYIGFGGAVTFKNARRPLEAAAAVPLDRLVLETDAPYMTPEPFRGKRCDSSYIQYTAQRLSEALRIDAQELLDLTCGNARQVYEL